MFKKQGRRIMSLLMVFAMVLTMLPPLARTANADAARIDINNLSYISDVDPRRSANPNDNNLVDRKTEGKLELTAYISGISDAQVPNIYYEIYNANTGATVVEKMNKALVTGNQITFSNVVLTEGLNRITVKLGESSVISSAPGWVYFNPVTNISSLKINDDELVEGAFYPKNMTAAGLNTALIISGKANNATEVTANIAGDATPAQLYYVNGFFQGVADLKSGNNSLANMKLNPGDNHITFNARNGSQYVYSLDRRFVYDNGYPFAYNATITYDKPTTPTPTTVTDYLVDQPSLTDNTVTLKARIKVPLVADSTSATGFTLQYPQVVVTPPDNVSTGPIILNHSLTTGPLTYNASASTATYEIYDYQQSVTLSAGATITEKTKSLAFTFSNPALTTSRPVTSAYSFYYTDTTLPYVQAVYMGYVDGYAGVAKYQGAKLNEVNNNVNEQPRKLRVFLDQDADSVNVYVDGSSTPATATKVTTTGKEFPTDPTQYVFNYQVNGLENGNHTFVFVPVKGGSENGVGAKRIDFTITSAPYVILDNLYNGQIIKTATLSCGTKINCISGRFVNVPQSDYERAEIVFNGGVPMRFSTGNASNPTDDFVDKTSGRFQFVYNGVNSRSAGLQEGLNTIEIYLYLSGKLISQAKYQIFVYTTDAPAFVGNVTPTPVNPTDRVLFPPTKTTDAYSTNESQVVFKGKYEGATSLKITARTKNPDGLPITMEQTVNIATKTVDHSPPTSTDTSGTLDPSKDIFGSTSTVTAGEFQTSPIKLNPKGDTIFDFEITNMSNIKVIRTVTISREPLPYRFLNLESRVVKNDKGEDQVTINSNYQVIIFEAEFADKVVVGKDEALKEPGTYKFTYEAKDLKPGKNNIKFTVYRGTDKTNGSLVLYDIDTPIEGASYKTGLASTMKVFDGQLQLTFPKDTSLMRNEETNSQQYLTTDRDVLFGIANKTDGRVNKDSEFSNDTAINLLREPTLRFRSASNLFWVDTGTIGANDYLTNLQGALKGSGRLPYEGVNFYTRQPKDLVVPTQRGTLTMKYDASIRDNAWKYLSVYHFGYYENEVGQVVPMWKNIGGVVDPNTNTIKVGFNSPGYYQVVYMAKSFQDITNHPWARDDLDTLYSKGYMNAKTPMSFVPNDFITRGEFATLLVKIFDVPLNYSGALTFDDVGLLKLDKLADYKSIETAARAGIVRGITETQFMPNLSITRQDAAVMIARAADLKLGNDTDNSLAALQKSFTDANGIDIYARTAVEAITKAGLIEGKENVLLQGQKKTTVRFDPLESFTRAEAAAVAIRVLKQQKKIPK